MVHGQILDKLKDKLAQSLENSWDLELFPEQIEITRATRAEFGHYQCNQAMSLAKKLSRPPRDIASKWLEHFLQVDHEEKIVESAEIAGPGFINISLSTAFLQKELQALDLYEMQEQNKKENGKRVVIDYSSPNTAKQMHVGHLRSTIIGDALRRLLEFDGWDVHAVNHIGDWGTQFGMLIAYIREEFSRSQQESWLQNPGDVSLEKLMELYRLSRKRFEEDEEFATRAKETVVALQAKKPHIYPFWEVICEVSRRDYQQIYDLLGVSLQEMGESFYNDLLEPMVKELIDRGIAVSSQGAKCIFIDGYDLPLMIQKSDGGFNYDTTDMAALRYRLQEMKADRIIYVTDAGQRLHFELVFAAALKAGWVDEGFPLDHVPFGLVLGEDGKKFKTRSGKTEKLMDLLNEAIERIMEILKTRSDIEDLDLEETARRLGVSAVKYADLCNDRISDYKFSYDKMLSFEGNTGIFLLYSHVRALSILRHVGGAKDRAPLHLVEESERLLALKILQFPEAITATLEGLCPHRLAEYLWGLASCFNGFFRDCRVKGDELERSRAHLVEKYCQVMAKGLELLGLQAVEKM